MAPEPPQEPPAVAAAPRDRRAGAELVVLSGIERRFGIDPPVMALRGVDLRVRAGEWLAVVGPSGSGKSTLLNIIGCLDRPDEGTYRFDGTDVASLSDRERAGLRSRGIGFVFQAFHLLAHRTVVENVMLAEVYGLRPRPGRRERALAALEAVGLGHRAQYLPTRLSGGERQRAAIARALVNEPALLLCDEPTGNLDSRTTGAILELLGDLHARGLTIIMITHDPDVAARAQRRIKLVDGAISSDGNSTADAGAAVPDMAHGAGDAGLGADGDSGSTGLRPADLVDEAIAGLFARPGRALLTVLGTVIGLGALVATLGLSRTASSRIVGRFDELSATEIKITVNPAESGATREIPWDAPQRLARLNGVVAAGNLSEIDVGDALVRTSPINDPQRRAEFKLGVVAASPDLFTAVRARLRTGRLLDQGFADRADRVVVLGPNAATQLGISRVDHLPTISIGDDLFTVIGILDGVERQFELLSAVVMPEGTAHRHYRLRSPTSVIVETKLGAASLLARQSPLALDPRDRFAFTVASPEQPQRIREAVQGDLDLLFLMLSGVSLLVGAIGIANVTLVSVMERIGEIGLRRALGATRGHIGLQFLTESAAMGVLGGILGASAGLLVVVGVALSQTWTPVIDPVIPLIAPVAGGVTGLLAGLYPALRAARLEPVEALRAGT